MKEIHFVVVVASEVAINRDVSFSCFRTNSTNFGRNNNAARISEVSKEKKTSKKEHKVRRAPKKNNNIAR